jgi:hypothetical protein
VKDPEIPPTAKVQDGALVPEMVPDDREVVTVEPFDSPNKPPTSPCPVMFPDDDASDTMP